MFAYYFCCQGNYGVIYCGHMANPTNTIDKRQVARSIRTLMDYAGINIEELGTLSASPASDDEEETRLSPEWEAMLQEARDEVARGDILGPFTSAEEAIMALHHES